MNEQHRQQVLDVLKTIRGAQEKKLYALCQDGADSLIGFLGKYNYCDNKIIAILDEYIRLIFMVHNNEVDISVADKHLVIIENFFTPKNDYKLEIVFLPYKASMWDALESVWLAAKDDPRCNAHVIPIPYYDRLPNGKLGEMHYEGDLYPDYVPVVDWKDYNIEEMKPDVAFIHNPFDDKNLLTCLPDSYQAKNLYNNVGLLVHLPYVVLYKEVRPTHIISDGVLISDITVVQSEKIKNIYVEHLAKLFGDNSSDYKKKIVAIGSPKADKILNSKISDFIIPDEWKDKSKGKHVIFFNTSIGPMLENTLPDKNNYLATLKNVLAYFKECENTIVLWRPHPLIEQAFKQMRPMYLAEYLEIRDLFISESYGIYDDSADVHRAVAFSNAYYGDGGSVVVMFCISGKPVQVHNYALNINHIEKLDDHLFTQDFIWEKNDNSNLNLFINSLNKLIVNNELRRNKFCNEFLDDTTGTAGKKILEYIFSDVKK